MGILFGILAALGQALSYVAIKRSFKDLNPSIAFFFDACFGLLLWIPFALIIGVDFSQLPAVGWIALLSALLSEAFVFYALSKGHLSISGTLFATYPVFTIFFSVLINNERLLALHWFFVFITILGILIVSLPKKLQKNELKEKLYIMWPLVAAMAVGLSDTLSKGIIDRTSAQTFLFALAFAQLPVAIGYLLFTRQSLRQVEKAIEQFHVYKWAIIGSFLNIIAVLFLWLAFATTYASIASPLTAAYPAILILFAALFLKERSTKTELVGLFLTTIGIVGISYFFY